MDDTETVEDEAIRQRWARIIDRADIPADIEEAIEETLAAWTSGFMLVLDFRPDGTLWCSVGRSRPTSKE